MEWCPTAKAAPAVKRSAYLNRLLQLLQPEPAAPVEAEPQPAADAEAERGRFNREAERLMDEYGTSILRYAYSYLHNMSDAEEVLQDTLIQFLKTRPRLDNPVHQKAWLLKVAGNLSKNRIKYNSVRRTDQLNEELAAEEREDLSFVWDAVRQLPEPYRSAIHLYYCEGYSVAQTAVILGKKETSVRSDLHRGRRKLKTILKEVYDFDEPV